MENRKQIAMIAGALALGIVAAFLMGTHIQNSIETQTREIAKTYETQKGAMAKEMAMVKKELLAARQERAELANQLQTIPQQIKAVKAQGGSAAGPDNSQKMALSVLTPPGKRALTIMIDSLSAVGGLINPGDYVDIIAHLKVSEGEKDSEDKGKSVTTVLFQKIQVLAVNTNFVDIGTAKDYAERQTTRSLNVTLAVTPEEAGLLTFAQTNGKLQMALRSPGEEQTEILEVASWESLSDFVLEKQGTELPIEEEKTVIRSTGTDKKFEPVIQIFRGGKEL
ncbi:MAG: Flp pilus assembly protein CpaB [Candidatus Omnitrophica bacterium]|nr:Flp pilus assembly protein CpaB [Candidatus Omnitrophota bacterium]